MAPAASAVFPSSLNSCSLESSPSSERIGLLMLCNRRIMFDIRDVMVSRLVGAPVRAMSSRGVSLRDISSSLSESWREPSGSTAAPLGIRSGGTGVLGTILSAAAAAGSGPMTVLRRPSSLPIGRELPIPSAVTFSAAARAALAGGLSGCLAAAVLSTRWLCSMPTILRRLEDIALAAWAVAFTSASPSEASSSVEDPSPPSVTTVLCDRRPTMNSSGAAASSAEITPCGG